MNPVLTEHRNFFICDARVFLQGNTQFVILSVSEESHKPMHYLWDPSVATLSQDDRLYFGEALNLSF